ncbi:MAG TPA: hypothetical protein VHW46_14785 [Terracidiphilus sp.]|jgi:hypothetical protein|nr:hypothetical protein [Terracidiphilus sp.]
MNHSARFVVAISVLVGGALEAHAQSGTPTACRLLSRATIAKATGLAVHKGKGGPPISGSLSNCTWEGPHGTRIVVTVADVPHMQTTMDSQVQSGATKIDGVGTNAVGTAGNAETEGGYNLSVMDAKGGVAVSILGNSGTGERTVALAKIIESHR